MFVETIRTPGLAHLSYLVGSNGEAAVIDPRRDFGCYVELAAGRGCRVTHVFETHRNEDLVSGSSGLAARTGARVLHGPKPAGPVTYADTAREDDVFAIGAVTLRVLETPGHTDDSLSFVLYDAPPEGIDGVEAVAVFTGDALFVGDVGRTDFYPERPREVAGALYDSLRKLLALGEQAVLYPAHGAGSVCGAGMADREVSTLGHEQSHNPRLALRDREAFIAAKIAEHHDTPPYFKLMEQLNLSGPPPLPEPLSPAPLAHAAFDQRRPDARVVDVRSAAAYLGAHVPGSLALPLALLSAYAGWLLTPGQPLLLVADGAAQAEEAARQLARIGFDEVLGFLAPSLSAWAAGGGEFGTLPVIGTETVRERVDSEGAAWTLLDVRGVTEVEEVRIPGARHVFLGELPGVLGELDRGRAYTVMCGSGARATVAASLLLAHGFGQVDLFLGSMAAWRRRGLATE